jgi:hypothetical protein
MQDLKKCATQNICKSETMKPIIPDLKIEPSKLTIFESFLMNFK